MDGNGRTSAADRRASRGGDGRAQIGQDDAKSAEQPSTHSRRRASPPIATRLPVRIPELVLGVALVAGTALGAVVWQKRVTTGREVVVAARAIARGSALEVDQLTTAMVRGASGITLLSAEDAAAVVGRVALVDIPAGMPLGTALLSTSVPLGPDEALVSVGLDRSHVPAGLAPGDPVRVVVVSSADLAERPSAEILDSAAMAWAVEPPTEYDAATVVTLRLPITAATTVSGADDVRLVRVEP